MAADKELNMVLNFQERNVNNFKKAEDAARKLLGVVDTKAKLEIEIDVSSTDQASRKIKKFGQDTEAALDQAEKSANRRIRGTITQAEAFVAKRRDVIEALNEAPSAAYKKVGGDIEVYKKAGIPASQYDAAKNIQLLRQRQLLIARMQGALSRASGESSLDDDTTDLLHEYNKIEEKKFQINRNVRPEELDFITHNRFYSLGQKINNEQNRLAVRTALESGSITGRSNLNQKELDALVGRMSGRVGLPDINALVKGEITTNRAQVSASTELGIKQGLFPIQETVSTKSSEQFVSDYLAKIEHRQAIRTLLAKPDAITPEQMEAMKKSPLFLRILRRMRRAVDNERGSIGAIPFGRPLFGRAPLSLPFGDRHDTPTPELDWALNYIKQQTAAGVSQLEIQKEVLKAIPGTNGRGFEVTGFRATPPIPTAPTLLEIHQGITQQSIDRARLAAGLPPGPGGRSFYMPGRNLYGPGAIIPGVNAPPIIAGGGGPPTPPIVIPAGGGGPPTPPPGGGGGGGGGGAGFLSKLGGKFASLSYYALAAAVIYPIFEFLRKSITAANDLEVVMKRIQAIYGNHTLGEQLEIKGVVVNTALRLSSNLVETARTAQLLAQEQIPLGKLEDTLRAIVTGSVGLGISQEGLANFVIAVRNLTATDVKPLEGDELVNMIAAFVRKGAVSPQNLMTSIQQVLPALETFSPNQSSINDPALIAAITSIAARNSSYTGSQVANSLKYMISKFGNPTAVEDIQDRAHIGLGTKDSGGQELRPFIDIIQDLAASYQHLIDTGQNAAAKNLLKDLFGPRQAGVGEILLKKLAQALQEARVAIGDTAAATELANAQQNTWNKTIERLGTVSSLVFGPLLVAIKGVGGFIIDLLVTPFEGWVLLIQQAGIAFDELRAKMGPGGVEALSGQRTGPEAEKYGLGGATSPTPKYKSQVAYLQNLNTLLTGTSGPVTPPAGVPLYSDADWRAFHRSYEKRISLISGQERAAVDFGAIFAPPHKQLNELTQQLERFYQAIKIENITPGETIFDYIARITGKDIESAKEMTKTYIELQSSVGRALQSERRRLEGISAITQGGRVEEATARALESSNRIRRRLARTYGRRGGVEYPIEIMEDELKEIAAGRIFDIRQENAAYALRVKLLQASPEFQQKRKPLRDAELKDLSNTHNANLAIIDVNTKELAIQTDINTQYEIRLKYLQDIESLSQAINSDIQGALIGLPAGTRSRGVFGRFIGSILAPVAGTLYKRAITNINIFGQQGLFPKVGKYLNDLVGTPEGLKDVQVPNMVNYGAGRFVQEGFTTTRVPKTAEELKRDQRAAQIRALELAVASTLGAAVGKGGTGAQAGAQLGALGGMALGAKLGSAGGPIGAVVGGLVGGLVGGIFDKHKKQPPELTALEIIARNTGEQLTLIENTNRLLELQNIAFNIPTGFTLPKFGPSLFGGQTAGNGNISNDISVEVNIGGSGSSAQEIGAVVADAVSARLQSEYSSGGRFVSRTGN